MKAPIQLAVCFFCILIFLPSAATSATSSNSAVRYKWVDGQGSLHFSDTLPQEALQRGYDVVNMQGLLVKHVDRPKSVEERKAEAVAAAAQAEAREHAAHIAAADRQLLATYGTDGDLEAVHRDRMDALDKALNNIKVSLADQEKGLAEQLAHAATFERDGKAVPLPVRQQIESLRKTIATQNTFIQRRELERLDLMRQSEAEMTHYRDLRVKQAQAAAQQ